MAVPVPKRFVDVLEAFDSHERGILFRWAAGAPFTISGDLRNSLLEELGRQVPAAPLVAMDYTLDWLHAALTCFSKPEAWDKPQPLDDDGAIRGSQEDIDLLIAWEDQAPHLVLMEAKGFTGWSNKQMTSKARRLGAILGDDIRELVDTHFVLVGPKASAGLRTDAWPKWMAAEGRVHFLDIPDPGPRWGVRRLGPAGQTAADPTAGQWTAWRPVARSWG